MIIPTLKTPAAVVNLSPSNMINACRYSAGYFSVNLSRITFSGSDVFSFLQSQSTFDVKLIQNKNFHLVSFLDPQGRLETYGWLLNKNDSFEFLFPPSLKDQTLKRLNKFLISEDVEISESEDSLVYFLLGPEARSFASPDAISGPLFDEEVSLQFFSPQGLTELTGEEVKTWRGLTGWPSFDGSDFVNAIINNLRLFDLSVVSNKGCYPGQETVSKIATRRGAAYAPVLIELNETISNGDVFSFEKKIGTISGCYLWEGKYFASADLLRDFRVEKLKIHFSMEDREYDGIVRYFPLLSGNPKVKAQELYFKATDSFKESNLILAEEYFRKAILLDPELADAYEALGVMLGREERFLEAIELMEKLSEVNPKSVLAHTNMSLYLMKIGKIPEAEEQKSLATIKSFQSFGDEALQKELKDDLERKQKTEWEQRESMYLQVLEIDPEDTLANYGLGSIALERKEWVKAHEHLQKVLSQDPNYSVAYLALGKALKGLNRLDEARAIWTEGVRVAAAKGDLMPANQMQQELSF